MKWCIYQQWFYRRGCTDVSALVIRTRTRCNRELLEGSKVKLVATATIGFDHIDVTIVMRRQIFWKSLPVVMPAV